MKKITLSNLINLTKEDLKNIEPYSAHNVDAINLVVNNVMGIIEFKDKFYHLHLNEFKKGSFNHILAVKDALKVVDKAIKFYNTYMDIFGKIHLNSNDKIYLSNLCVEKWYRNYMYFYGSSIK